MILKKVGEDIYNGKSKNVYLVWGIATRDAEAKGGDVPHYATGLALGEDSNGVKQYITVNAWRERAKDLKTVLKNDSLLVLGTVSSREYNGKTYTDLNAIFIAVSGGAVQDWATPAVLPAGDGVPVFVVDDDDDDGELPF